MNLEHLSDEQLMAIAGVEQARPKSFTDKLGETWPARAARAAWSGLTLPGDVMAGRAALPSSGAVPESVPFGHPDSAGERVADLAGLATPINPAIRAGDRVIPGVAKQPFTRAEPPAVPTTQELVRAGADDINAAKASDLRISPAAVADFSRQVQQDLFERGIHPTRANDTFRILKELEDVPAGSSFTPANLQTLRETLRSVAQNFNPNFAKDQLAASAAIKRFDDFLSSVAPKDVVAGPAAAQPGTQSQLVARALQGQNEAQRVSEQFRRGRGNYAAAQRSNDITGELDRAYTGILERGELGAQVANSGRNIDNRVRQSIASVLRKEKEVSGLNDAEFAALEAAATGGRGRNAARTVGNWLGGGGGMGQSLLAALGAGAGAMTGNIGAAAAGAAVPMVAGSGFRSLANALAKRDLNKVDELLRKRSPLYEERVANPVMGPGDQSSHAALLRALLLERQQ